MRVSLCLLACFCVASAISPHKQDGFYYTKSHSMFRRNNEDDCRVCFGHDCVPLREANCEYYMATTELQSTPDDDDDDAPNLELKTRVDKMLFDFIDSTQEYQPMDCIPLISTYTDCHKENLCTGCRTCTCDGGKWACTTEECVAGRQVGSKELMVAAARMKGEDEQVYRKKRSINGTNSETDNITFDDLSQWIRDQPPATAGYGREIVLPKQTRSKLTTSSPDYLAFDEVLSNIAADKNNISRKKAALEPVHDEYVNFGDIVNEDENTTHNHENKYAHNVILDSMDTYTGNSFKIDLLEDLKNRLEDQFGVENYTGSSVVTSFIKDVKNNKASRDFDMNNSVDDDRLSIVKRDVDKQSKECNITESFDGNNNTIGDFKKNVLQPLLNIVEDKENELKQLHSIKASLVKLITTIDSNFSLDQMANNTDKNQTLFSIYKLEIVPEKEYDYRRTGTLNIIERYTKKLKRDVHEVLKDLKGIKDNILGKSFPRDLELLFHALKRYIRQQEKSYLKNIRQYRGSRLSRRFEGERDTSVKHMMYEILKACDQELAGRDSLNQLSNTARDVLERVIIQNQIPDLIAFGMGISNPTYNLTKELKNIGAKWADLSKKVLYSSSPDQIYHLKLLHLVLMVDIKKMKDALKRLEIDKNRRTILETESSDQEMKRIENVITDLNKKIGNYLQKGLELNKNETIGLYNNTTEKNATEKSNEIPTKKRSFLNQIKMLFRRSRPDIRNMLHKKMSKSEIVKQLAKNKLDDIAKQKMAHYEETLKKWQAKLGGARIKRANFEHRNRKDTIKNILPLYLRGKVHPGIEKSKKKDAKRSGRHGKYRNGSSKLNGLSQKPINRKKDYGDIMKRIDIHTNITKKTHN